MVLSLVGAHIQAALLHSDLDLQLRLETAMTGTLAEACWKLLCIYSFMWTQVCHGPIHLQGSRLLFCMLQKLELWFLAAVKTV